MSLRQWRAVDCTSGDSDILSALVDTSGCRRGVAHLSSTHNGRNFKRQISIMSGIFTLSIACIAGRHLTQEYRFVLDVPAVSTLDDLASFILGMVDFDGEHLSEFYVANGLRGKKTWFTADGEWGDDDSDMWDIHLSNVFPLGRNKKLYYVYDFGASWCFEIVKKGRETTALVGLGYPCIVSQEGVKPMEYGHDRDDHGDGDDDPA